MLIIGLTGGIGMGKSTAARIFCRWGLPVYNADKAVHDLLKRGGKAVAPVAALFPTVVKHGTVDRILLGKIVFGHPPLLRKLEKILHPLVQKVEHDFIRDALKRNCSAVILEIPLLFETKAHDRCDKTICVSAPPAVQRARVLRRKNMTMAKYKAICKHQMPDLRKRDRADFVVMTHRGYADTKKQLKEIMSTLHLSTDSHA